MVVRICAADDASEKCADGSGPGAEVDGAVHLKPNLTDVQLKTALGVRLPEGQNSNSSQSDECFARHTGNHAGVH